jgi:hypothetical protein
MVNDVTRELKIVVERVVRPVVAPRNRRKAMRRELLAHVSEVFAEERDRAGDDATALERTKQRFGDSPALTAELQQSIPTLQRAASRWESLDWSKNVSLTTLARRTFLLMLASAGVMFLIILPGALWGGRIPTLDQFAVRLCLGQGVFVGLLVTGIPAIGTRLGEAAFSSSAGRSWPLAAAYLLATMTFVPTFAFLFYWALTSDLSASLRHFNLALWFVPGVPLLLLLLARQSHLEQQYEREWSELDLSA